MSKETKRVGKRKKKERKRETERKKRKDEGRRKGKKKEKKKEIVTMWVTDTLIRLVLVIISQCIGVLKKLKLNTLNICNFYLSISLDEAEKRNRKEN